MAVVSAARRAAADYEFAKRIRAPRSLSAAPSGSCDEQVGRYCLIFDTGKNELPPEPESIGVARDTAIARLARAAERYPGRNDIAFTLLRYLVRANRPADAIAAAGAYARATTDPATGRMALGFALHHARATIEATRELEAWVEALSPREKDKIRDLDWLLSERARRLYKRMPDAHIAAFERLAWRFADPLLLTPGNELWADHLARHAAGRMIRDGLPGSETWGADVEQLTVRFGETVLTTKTFRTGSVGLNESYSEHWDPSQRTYFPPNPDSALTMAVRLDTIWPLDTLISRSGHSPPTIRRMRVLEHQAVPFDDSIRISVVAFTDEEVKNPLTGAVFLLDSALNVIARVDYSPSEAAALGDSVMFVTGVPLVPASQYYSAEVYDPVSRFAARARYRIDRPQRPLSGILLAYPFEPGRLPDGRSSDLLRPLSRPVIRSGDRFGVYAEIDNRGNVRRSVTVEVEVRSLERGSVLTRAVGWVGNTLGLTSPRSPARLGWSVELEADRVTSVPVTLDLGSLKPGAYRVLLRMEDGAGSTDVVSVRDFAVVNSR